jgi:cytochrome c
MSRHTQYRQVVITALALPLLALASAAHAMDPSAAEFLMKQNGCDKCHHTERHKDGPAYRDVAAKFLGDPAAVEKVTHHITSGEMVTFEDGHEEAHKKIKANKPEEITNLVQWILSLPGGKKY